jgi:hypothetical protein
MDQVDLLLSICRRLDKLEREREEGKTRPPVEDVIPPCSPPSRGRAWSQFESETISSDILEIVHKRRIQFGRTTNSIIWAIWRMVDKWKVREA